MGTLLLTDKIFSKFCGGKLSSFLASEAVKQDAVSTGSDDQDMLPFSRSPIDSPPIQKKKRLASASYVWNRSGEEMESKSNATVTRSNTFPGAPGPKSILKQRTSRLSESSLSDRRVQFNRDTWVQFIDVEGTKTTSTEQLCIEPKDRKQFMLRNLKRISNNQQHLSAGNTDNIDQLTSQMFTYKSTDSDNTHEVHLSFARSDKGNIKLKMLVKVDYNISPDEICVKANMSGNKIRVLASKIIHDTESGDKKTEPFNERFLLPVEVDPFAVEARLDNKGNLTIEAPIKTQSNNSKQSAIVKDQANEDQNKSL